MPSKQIESKNLMIIEDQATQEKIAAKKMEAYVHQLEDVSSKNIASRLADHHHAHFNNLLDYLNSHQ